MTEQYSNSFSKQFREDQEEFLNIAIKKWKFHKNFKRNLIMFSLIGVFFLVFAIIFLVNYFQITAYSKPYETCNLGGNCVIPIDINSDMQPTIFVYYELDNFYTSNRNYFLSMDADQLKGKPRTIAQLNVSCTGYVTNKDMGKTVSLSGNQLVGSDIAYPCGQIAFLYFNDSYSLQNSTHNISIDQNDLTWEIDRQENFIFPQGYENKSWIDYSTEHFMVWMRSAGLGKFKKLWGRINSTISRGQYNLTIQNSFFSPLNILDYDVSSYNGKKTFLMTTSSAFGQKNLVLVGSYFAGAAICLFSIIIMLLIYYRDKKKKIV